MKDRLSKIPLAPKSMSEKEANNLVENRAVIFQCLDPYHRCPNYHSEHARCAMSFVTTNGEIKELVRHACEII